MCIHTHVCMCWGMNHDTDRRRALALLACCLHASRLPLVQITAPRRRAVSACTRLACVRGVAYAYARLCMYTCIRAYVLTRRRRFRPSVLPLAWLHLPSSVRCLPRLIRCACRAGAGERTRPDLGWSYRHPRARNARVSRCTCHAGPPWNWGGIPSSLSPQ